jgi:hypothetical protein
MKEIAQLTDKMSDSDKAMLEKEAGEAIPSAGRLNSGGIVAIIGALAAFALLVVTFAKKSLVPMLAVGAVGLTAVSAAIYPYVRTGPLDGMAPRMQAIVALVLVVIGAAGAMLAAKKTTTMA